MTALQLLFVLVAALLLVGARGRRSVVTGQTLVAVAVLALLVGLAVWWLS